MKLRGVHKKLDQYLFGTSGQRELKVFRLAFRLIALGIRILGGLCLSLVLGPLSLFRPVEIWLMKLGPDKASHFVDGIERNLRRKQLEGSGRKSICIVVWPQKFPNEALAKMYRRVVFIVGPRLKFFANVLPFVVWRRKIVPYKVKGTSVESIKLLSPGGASIRFSKSETRLGETLLTDLFGDPSHRFVLFGYTSKEYRSNIDQYWHKEDELFSAIPKASSFVALIKKLNDSGIGVVRQGLNLEFDQALASAGLLVPEYDRYPSGFVDVWLASKADFLISACTGSWHFGVPFKKFSVITDLISPRETFPQGTLGLFQLPWLIKEKRFADFEWMAREPRWCYNKARLGVDYEIRHNTPSQIIDVVDEQLARISGTWIETDEDTELQRRYREFAWGKGYDISIVPRIGAKFLREHQHLLP